MKRSLLIAILAASASACVEGNNPVQLLEAIPKDPKTCEPGNTALIRGRLNYDAGQHYYTTFSLFSPLEAATGSSGVGFYGEEFVYNYTSKNPSVSFKEESLPIYFVVQANTEGSWVGVDLIGDDARKKLEAAVPAAPDAMTLLVQFKLKGKLASGKTVETNEVTYPIEISRQGGCTTGTPAAPADSPCAFPGQDGNGFICQ
jgi:hypothetical protein